MVKKRILAGEWIQALPTPEKLHKIHSKDVIKEVCNKVITAIEKCDLILIDTHKLLDEARHLRKKKWRDKEEKVFSLVDYYDQGMRNSAWIRDDWKIEAFKEGEIQWYIFYDETWEVLWLIYLHKDRPDNEYMYLHKDIFIRKIIAADIIIEFSEKYKKVWKKSHHS